MIANQLKDSFKRSLHLYFGCGDGQHFIMANPPSIAIGWLCDLIHINEEIWQILIVWPIVLQVDLQKVPGMY